MHFRQSGDTARVLCRTGCVLLLLTLGCRTPVDPPDPPSGGRTFILDFATFESTVDPILQNHGCNAGGDCHGGGIRGTLVLSPANDRNLSADFEQVSLQVNGLEPPQSPILTKPLATEAGGSPHSVEAFTSTGEPDYQAILGWIEDGVFQ